MGRAHKKKKGAAGIRVTPPSSLDYPGFSFNIQHKDPKSKARVGLL